MLPQKYELDLFDLINMMTNNYGVSFEEWSINKCCQYFSEKFYRLLVYRSFLKTNSVIMCDHIDQIKQIQFVLLWQPQNVRSSIQCPWGNQYASREFWSILITVFRFTRWLWNILKSTSCSIVSNFSGLARLQGMLCSPLCGNIPSCISQWFSLRAFISQFPPLKRKSTSQLAATIWSARVSIRPKKIDATLSTIG